MTFTIVTCTWGREALSRAVLQYYANIELPGIQLRFVVGGENFGVKAWDTVNVMNHPLGAKWNATLVAAAYRTKPDAVMIVGSDDLVRPEYIAHAAELVAYGVDLVSPRGLYVVDIDSGKVIEADQWKPGAGRVISKVLGDQYEWKFWQDDTMHRLDGAFDRTLWNGHYAWKEEIVDGAKYKLVDIKTADGPNVWGFRETEAIVRNRTVNARASDWLRQHYPEFDYTPESKLDIRL